MKHPSPLLLLACAVSLAAQTVNYTYDQAGRLSSVTYPNGTTATYAYDASGNLLRKVIAAKATGTPPAPFDKGVVNVASEQNTTVAPGEMVAIYGNGIGPATRAFSPITPASFFDTLAGNTTVTFDGIPAPLYYASAGQTAAIVPYSVAGQSSTLMIVTFNGVASPPMTVSVAPSAPGLFSANSSGTGNGAIGNHDGSVNSPSNPEARGSVIVLYGTGEGQSNPRGVDGRIASAVYPKPLLPVKVTIGGVDATAGILYAGAAPTLVTGVFQNQCDSAAECADGRGAGGGDNRAGPRQPTDPGPIPPTIRQRSPYPQVGFTGRLPFISEGHSKIKGLRVSKVSLISDFMSSG